MKQRVMVSRHGTYYPQYKWLFWWCHHRHDTTLGFAGTTWKERRGEVVRFHDEDDAIHYLDMQYRKRTDKQTVAWINWNPPE